MKRTDAPLVSIVITAFNAEAFVGACIRAALSQTYWNIEVVVVDDGSNDETAEICRSFTDTRVRYLSWGRLGRPRALNRGVAAARGRYIAINDADDLSLPHRIGNAVAFLEDHPNAAYVGTGFAKTEMFLETPPAELLTASAVADDTPPIWPSRTALFCRNLFNNSTLVYPKSTWETIGGYDESLGNSEDYDFYLRALQCGPAALLRCCTVLWYTNPNGFFKQKTRQEQLQALATIRTRAHRVLGLPLWLRWYHPVWAVYFEFGRRFPSLIHWVGRARRTIGRQPS